MKKFIVWTLFALLTFGAGRELSPLPLPTLRFISLDTYPCDRYCLQEHLQRGEIFSFLAKLQPNEVPYFKEALATIPFIKPTIYKEHFFIALVTATPKLSPLLSKTARTLSTALLQQEQPFHISTYFNENLQEAINNAQEADLIIAFIPFSQRAQIANLSSDTPLFIPTINRRFVTDPGTFYYGGIDYFKQIDALLQFSSNALTIFNTPNVELTNLLTQYALNQKENAETIEVKNGGSNLKWQIEKRESLQYNDILLNTPLVTTSLVLSQLTLYGYTPPKKLSTQINLSPKFFTFTQEDDRINLIFANIAGYVDPLTQSACMLFETNLFYDWIDYVTLVALHNILMPQTGSITPFIDHQLQFQTTLWRYHTMGLEQIPPKNSQESLPDDSL